MNPLDIDPSQTDLIRKSFSRDFNRRLEDLYRKLYQLVVRDDTFGLREVKLNVPLFNVFCPTGPGGGVDPTCSPKSLSGSLSWDFTHEDSYAGPVQKVSIGKASVIYQMQPTGNVQLSSIRVPHKYRKQGQAKKALKTFLEATDDKGLTVELLASPLDKKTKLDKLVKFYENEGFEIEGRGNAFGEPKMVRKPKPVSNTEWKFQTSAQKLKSFEQWMIVTLSESMSEEEFREEGSWWTKYIRRAWKKGNKRSHDEAKKKQGGGLPGAAPFSGEYNDAVSEERLKALVARTFTDIDGMTKTTATSLSRTLADGLIRGESPKKIAKALKNRIDITKKQAERIVRTECLLGDTFVNAAVVRAVFRRWYDGDVIEIKTRNGRCFTTTPNHPMLTQRGWVSSGLLKESDQLICDVRQQNFCPSGYPNIDGHPAQISQLFNSVNAVGISERRATREPDFHGDGRNSYVNIARPYRLLSLGRFTSISKPIAENVFSESGFSSSLFCSLCSNLLPINKTSCFCGGSGVYPSRFESPCDCITSDRKLLCNLLQGNPAFVKSGELFNRQVNPSIAVRSSFFSSQYKTLGRSPGNPSLSEDLSNLLLVGTDSLGNLSLSHSTEIQLDDVVSLTLRPFSGHVYNLETEEGYFNIAGGAYTGNTVRAQAEGQLNALEKLGIDKVGVRVEFKTAGDGKVCPECNKLSGRVFKVKDSHGIIPVHPNCRCGWVPVVEPLPKAKQTRKRIERSILSAVNRTRKRR